jgi:hypothetical protein
MSAKIKRRLLLSKETILMKIATIYVRKVAPGCVKNCHKKVFRVSRVFPQKTKTNRGSRRNFTYFRLFDMMSQLS